LDARSKNSDQVCQIWRFVRPLRLINAIKPAGYAAGLIAALLILVGCDSADSGYENEPVLGDSARGYLTVEISDDLVTLQADDVGTQHVVDEIARQSGLIVVSDLLLDDRLTLEFERLPLSDALRRIMRDQNYLLYQAQAATGPGNASPGSRSTLWIFADGSAHKSGHKQAADRFSSDTESKIETLQSQLISDDRRVRQQAVRGLRKLKVNDVIAPLSYALADEDKDIRVEAIYALAEVGGQDAVAALAAASGDENAWVRAETASALGTLGGDAAVQGLWHALHDADSNVRQSAISALAQIGGGPSTRALAIALKDTDAALRVEAVDALGDIGGETALGLLHQAMEDHDDAVRNAASEALAELSSQDL
jgi:hypothetical protein